MRKMKKFFAFLLTMVMVLGMATSVFAAPGSKEANLNDHTYKAYQIFTGTQAEDSAELGNIEWGTGVDGAAVLADLQDSDAFVPGEGEANLFAECETAADVAAVMSDWADHSDLAKAFAQIAYNHKVGNGTVVKSGNTTLAAGYYLVVDVTEFGEDAEDTVYNLSLLQLTKKGTFEIANKTDVPEVDKVIVEGQNEVKLNEKGMGKTNTYKITGTLPTNFADYETYYYWFKDTLSKGLTYESFNEDGTADLSKITVNVVNPGKDPVNVSQYFYKNVTKNDDGTTTIDVAIKDLKALNLIDGVTVDKDSQIVVTYQATVNKDAVIAGEGNPNDVDLEYSNNPDNNGEPTTTPPGPNPGEPTTDHPTGITPKDKVVTYVTELLIHKVDEKGNPLAGVEFTLVKEDMVKVNVKKGTKFEADENGTYYKLANGTYTKTAPIEDEYEEGWNASMEGAADHLKVKNNRADYDAESLNAGTMYALKEYEEITYTDAENGEVAETVDENGMINFSGLGAGEYTLKETATPNGYNTIDDIKFEITFDSTTHKFSVINATAPIAVEADNTLFTEIVNYKGTTLPETGGMGTTIFYVVGSVLVMIAGVLLITKRRMVAR